MNSDYIKYIKLFSGIVHGKKAFTGPYLVQLDLTNSCNTRCLYCMNYSEWGLKKEYSKDWGNIFLGFDTIRRIVPELKSVGVKEIDVTGNGEPFMHPDIIKIIKFIKENGMRCVVRTNGLLIDTKIINQLFDIGLNGIDLSLWAGSPEGYAETHPMESPESFSRINNWLMRITELRAHEQYKKLKFKLKILNVIARHNYSRIEEMLSFAYKVKADYVMFKYLLEEFFKEDALKQIALTDEDKKQVSQIWKKSVYKNKVRNNLGYFIKAFGKSFRVDNCYLGWLYSRLTVTGEVVPCCGCLGHDMGNFKEHSFHEIWFGQRYNEFRKKSRNINSDSYFMDCSCSKICPHSLPIISLNDLLHHMC